MTRFLRLVLAVAMLGALVVGNVASTIASGSKVFDAQMVGIPTAGLMLDGLTGGGVPWVLDSGRAKLFADGRLDVEVEGLVLATNHTNPVANGLAVVACGNVAVAQSEIVPFSPAGDAEVETTVSLPSPCLAPAVFFVGVTATGAQRWFAVTGF